jgi:hypothetical protein
MSRVPVAVKASFDEQGKITPLEFVWKGSHYPVTSVGRTWDEAAERHVLVMDLNAQVYELILALPVGRWYLIPPKQFLSKA